MLAQTSLSPYMHSPVSSYQVGLFSETRWLWPNPVSESRMHFSASCTKARCLHEYSSCCDINCTLPCDCCEKGTQPVLDAPSVIPHAASCKYWYHAHDLMQLSEHGVTPWLSPHVHQMDPTGYSSDPHYGSCHVHPAHFYDGTPHSAAKPPVPRQHRHSKYYSHNYTGQK